MNPRALIGIILFWPLHVYVLGESMFLMGSAWKPELYLGYLMFIYSVLAILWVSLKCAPRLLNGCMEAE